jgi:hypothetical protein
MLHVYVNLPEMLALLERRICLSQQHFMVSDLNVKQTLSMTIDAKQSHN